VGWKSLSIDELAAYSHIAFANDSVYGPIGSLDRFCQFLENTNYDMFGMTDSFEHMYHIQSWFLVFKNNDRASRFLTWFWRRFKFYNNRTIAIFFYEIGMTQLAIEYGLKVGAFAPYSRVRRLAEARMDELGYVSHTLCRTIDPTQYYWLILIENFDMPFIKRSLLSGNDFRIPDLVEVKAIAASRGFDISMIANHLGWE
jgi:lipopolysaccharide biosynthesis protein